MKKWRVLLVILSISIFIVCNYSLFKAVYFSVLLRSENSVLNTQDNFIELYIKHPKYFYDSKTGHSPGELMDEIENQLKRNDVCEKSYGYSYLKAWNSTAKSYCLNGTTKFECLEDLFIFRKIGKPSKGSHQCRGINVYMQLELMQKLERCVPLRNPWHCKDIPRFHYLTPGSFTGDCIPNEEMKNIKLFTYDHLRNYVNGWNREPFTPAHTIMIDADVLIVSRENGEYCNMYHAHTDILNAFAVMYLYNLKPKSTLLIFFDEHGKSPFDDLWQYAFSGYGLMKSISYYPRNAVIKARSINIVPSGYLSWMNGASNVECDHELSLYGAYRRYILEWVPIVEFIDTAAKGVEYFTLIQNPVAFFTIIERKPYENIVNRKKISRQFENSQEILSEIQNTFPKVLVRMIDLSGLNFTTQLSIDQKTNVLIGIHGAGLGHVLYLPPNSSLIEISITGSEWDCFNGIATSRNLYYKRLIGYGHSVDEFKYKVDVQKLLEFLKVQFKQYL